MHKSLVFSSPRRYTDLHLVLGLQTMVILVLTRLITELTATILELHTAYLRAPVCERG